MTGGTSGPHSPSTDPPSVGEGVGRRWITCDLGRSLRPGETTTTASRNPGEFRSDPRL